jgi:hypothetical protein
MDWTHNTERRSFGAIDGHVQVDPPSGRLAFKRYVLQFDVALSSQ